MPNQICLIDQLKQLSKLEATKNNGRGVSCVRTIIQYILKGFTNLATACALNEDDKISSYPDIKNLLRKILPRYDEELKHLEMMLDRLKRRCEE